MSADPPFIIPSARPFKVEATPSKMGGVDALAKRPLDMSGQAEQVTAHRESVPQDDVPPDTWVPLPDEAAGELGGDGPVLQELIDTSHREYFDDPSRYLRTDVMVKVPSTGAPPDEKSPEAVEHGAALAGGDVPASMAGPDAPRPHRTRPAASRPSTARQAEPSPLPTSYAASAPRTSGDPKQRRHAFNERLANIISRQQRINEELSAVEQAVQSTRTGLKQDPTDDTLDKS